MKYTIVRTETADVGIRKIILYVACNFGSEVAIEKLSYLEDNINSLASNPNLGTVPSYPVLKRHGIKVLILKKDLVFYKVDNDKKQVVIYAVVDQRQDYLNIIRGLIS